MKTEKTSVRRTRSDSALTFRLPDGSRLGEYEGKVAPEAFKAAKRCVRLIRTAERLQTRSNHAHSDLGTNGRVSLSGLQRK
jgi:hypothetical protein